MAGTSESGGVQVQSVNTPLEVVAQDTLQPRDIRSGFLEGPSGLVAQDGGEVRRAQDQLQGPRIEPSARPVITQLVQAAKSAIDGLVEVRLSPEELGRVRLAMTSGDVGMTVQVAAERPETLDLIRRHIDLLAADLNEQGFTDLTFSFAEDGTGDDQKTRDEVESGTSGTSVTTVHLDTTTSPLARLDGRLDLRL